MRKISVTEALNELKLYDSKIRKTISNSVFCGAAKKSSDKVGVFKKDDFDERAKASHQSVTDLIANRNSLKSAIVKSNATTDVDVNGKIMTRAEAIERKNSIEYEELLLAEMKRQYANATTTVDKENKKVSIGYKQLQPQPWDLAEGKYAVGDIIHGKVVRIVPFGAFVEVEKGIDGLVHVSQISHERIETPATVLNVGDEVDAKIVALDVDAKKMNLSIKAILPEPERAPRAPRNEGGEDNRKGRFTRRNSADDELSTWSEGSISGTSIADLIASAKNNK